MAIVCGTDFSEASLAALSVANQLALKMRQPLHLVHAVDLAPSALYDAPRSTLLGGVEAQLAKEAERLRAGGVDVTVHAKLGAPDEVMRDVAQELDATLIIVGALGQRKAGAWQLGSHADRTAERTHIPVLVVRDAAPFEAWARGARPLRVVLGVDHTQSSEIAGRWITELAALGPIEVVLTHLYWPPEEFHRLGLGGLRSVVDPDAEIVRSLEQEYNERFASLFHVASVTSKLEPHLGRVGDGLAALANSEHADLVVVGCHERGPLARVWQGSVSQRVLRFAETSVACVPAPRQAPRLVTPVISKVLAATDFSPIGNQAIPLAYSVVGYGGTVHLLHVVEGHRDSVDPYDILKPRPGADTAQLASAQAELSALVPKDAASVSAATRVHVIEAPDIKAAICQVAERLNVDLICLGTHGRSGVARTVLGSVAESVVAHTHRPVLLARLPRD